MRTSPRYSIQHINSYINYINYSYINYTHPWTNQATLGRLQRRHQRRHGWRRHRAALAFGAKTGQGPEAAAEVEATHAAPWGSAMELDSDSGCWFNQW